jgi:hypothetical protein
MNSRDRFCETMRYGTPDRVPYFEEGIRDDVLRVWRRQGLQGKAEFESMFRHDRREEIDPDLDVLRQDPDAIRREVEEKVPPLLAAGGCIPILDGRVRVDVPFGNYVYYKRLLEKVIGVKLHAAASTA